MEGASARVTIAVYPEHLTSTINNNPLRLYRDVKAFGRNVVHYLDRSAEHWVLAFVLLAVGPLLPLSLFAFLARALVRFDVIHN